MNGVLIERDGRLEFYTRFLKPGYVVPTRAYVTMFRAGRVLPFPIGFGALLLVHPPGPWSAAFLIATVAGAVDLLRYLLLRRLPRTEESLPVDVWRHQSVMQESPLYLSAVVIGTIALVVPAVALMIIRRQAPMVLVLGCVLFSLGAVLAARQWHNRRRALLL